MYASMHSWRSGDDRFRQVCTAQRRAQGLAFTCVCWIPQNDCLTPASPRYISIMGQVAPGEIREYFQDVSSNDSACKGISVRNWLCFLLLLSHFSESDWQCRSEADFTRHPETMGLTETVKLVRYQENPRGWGPAKKAGPADLKRKRSSEELDAPPAKH